jgi:hypothetical protein
LGDADPATTQGNHSLGGLGVDAAGNVLIAGQFTGTLKLSDTITLSSGTAGKQAVFIAKLDSSGHAVWGNAYTDGNGIVQCAAVGPSGNIVVGGTYAYSMTVGTTTLFQPDTFHSAAFLIDLDTNGAVVLARAYGGGNASVNGVGVGADGAIAITGGFTQGINLGGNLLSTSGAQPDIFVAKLDANGNHLLSNRFGDAAAQEGTSVVITSDGGVVFTGWADGTTNFGGMALTATHTSTFLAKLNSVGAHVFSHLYDNSAPSDAGRREVVRGPNDVLYVTTEAKTAALNHVTFGTTVVDGYSYRAAFTAGGDINWVIGLAGYSGAPYGAVDPVGNLVLAGEIQGATDLGFGTVSPLDTDAYVARYETMLGAPNAVVPIVDANQQSGLQEAGGVATDAQGNWAVGGTFSGVIDLGAGELTAAKGFGGTDIFVALIKP